jgi:hypothetical protein
MPKIRFFHAAHTDNMVIELAQNHILVLAGQPLCTLHQIDHLR